MEDDPDLRGYLATIVNHASGLEVAFSAGTVAEAVAACRTQACDLALVDLQLPDGSGLDFVAELKRQCDARTLILTVLGDRQSVLVALHAGADGYLLKDTPADQLRRSIEMTLAGESPISPQAATYLLELIKREPASSSAGSAGPASPLTTREAEILRLFSRGLSYRETGEVLSISSHTVGDHVKAIYRKLSVHSRAEAIFEARSLGLIASDE
ncbi:response regulator transcription factor [Marinicauda algicola]|uniref:Response regulator transcription factor n=1 Tax=Marinicauda algicola TaxID=2029849 RepID=A0A4V3RYK5_9PROT|nr:response regulator transcription factor [Marinicauda algicola]